MQNSECANNNHKQGEIRPAYVPSRNVSYRGINFDKKYTSNCGIFPRARLFAFEKTFPHTYYGIVCLSNPSVAKGQGGILPNTALILTLIATLITIELVNTL